MKHNKVVNHNPDSGPSAMRSQFNNEVLLMDNNYKTFNADSAVLQYLTRYELTMLECIRNGGALRDYQTSLKLLYTEVKDRMGEHLYGNRFCKPTVFYSVIERYLGKE